VHGDPEVSAHWLRYAHANDAIDGGAPITSVGLDLASTVVRVQLLKRT
jgi:hypothetical protein